MIREPHRTYVLELIHALGDAAPEFVLAGAQALRFFLTDARPTRDFDFILNVYALRNSSSQIAEILSAIGYEVVERSEHFQFSKVIPGTSELMLIEFMAPAEYAKRPADIRVWVQDKVHGHALKGGTIAIRESDFHVIEGFLPEGVSCSASLRVVRPHALVMLKIFAISDRLQNIRGAEHADHDRNEARIHTVDVVAILRAQDDLPMFWQRFREQFDDDAVHQEATSDLRRLFGSVDSPGLLLYEEYLRRERDVSRREAEPELERVVLMFATML